MEWREHEVQSSWLAVGVPARLDECVTYSGDVQLVAADLEDRQVWSVRHAQAVNLVDATQQQVTGVSDDASHLEVTVRAEETNAAQAPAIGGAGRVPAGVGDP